jgi:hypothetical protein
MANSETNVTVARPAVLIAAKIQTFYSVTRCRLKNSYGRCREAKFRNITGDFNLHVLETCIN